MKVSGQEKREFSFLSFCSLGLEEERAKSRGQVREVNRLDITSPSHVGEGTSSLLSLLIQMLTCPRNTLMDTSKSDLLVFWVSFSPVKLAVKSTTTISNLHEGKDLCRFHLLESFKQVDNTWHKGSTQIFFSMNKSMNELTVGQYSILNDNF